MRRSTVSRIFRRLTRSNANELKLHKNAPAQDGSGIEAKVFHDVVDKVELDEEGDRSHLHTIPTELQMQIIACVSFKDICSLRQTSRRTATILSGDVLSHWLAHHVPPLQTHFYAPPCPLSFTYILEQDHRLYIAREVSKAVGHFAQEHVLMYLNMPQRGYANLLTDLDDIWRGDMVHILLMLQHYLERLGHLWLTLPMTPLSSTQTFSEEFARGEKRIFAEYEDVDGAAELLYGANRMWEFLLWVSKYLLNKPVYDLAREREPPISDEDFRTYIVFTNIRGLLALLRMRTYWERRKAINAVIASLDPTRNPSSWRESWKCVSLKLEDEGPGRLQVEGTQVVKLGGMYDVWTKSARATLLQMGLVRDWEEMCAPVGTARQALYFLKEVAGYTIVQNEAPPWMSYPQDRWPVNGFEEGSRTRV